MGKRTKNLIKIRKILKILIKTLKKLINYLTKLKNKDIITIESKIKEKEEKKMFGNEKFQMIEDRNLRKEIKLNKRNKRLADEYINQYF